MVPWSIPRIFWITWLKRTLFPHTHESDKNPTFSHKLFWTQFPIHQQNCTATATQNVFLVYKNARFIHIFYWITWLKGTTTKELGSVGAVRSHRWFLPCGVCAETPCQCIALVCLEASAADCQPQWSRSSLRTNVSVAMKSLHTCIHAFIITLLPTPEFARPLAHGRVRP